ncbi:hypothetical protein OG413_38265 [Streptomyces sp. NBC_01433]|uniref:hypothetical protein n=1 Tax=Streptomyces sp. NBC_01433 TaxID=2903864 RepID=UPI00225684AB|nr:hypothetical protein [Streptomyces sp. NBC_01433]MCX4681056.1 hypothetical protein [Streptomyces sp. NBC_01433]
MDTRPPHILATANTTAFLLVCAVFFLHCLGVGFYPDGVAFWFQNSQWLMWTAAALAVVSAQATPSLSLRTQRLGGDR